MHALMTRLTATFLFALTLFALPLAAHAQESGPQQDTAPQEVTTALENLLNVLRDEEARAALVEELESAVDAAGDSAQDAQEAAPGSMIDVRSAGGQIAEMTQWAIESTLAAALGFWDQIAAAPGTFSALTGDEMGRIGVIVLDLAALVVVTYGALAIVRAAIGGLRGRVRDAVDADGPVSKLIGIVIGFVIDIGLAIIPWALGYLAALTILGSQGRISFAHSLFLNAFVLIEVTMALLRVVFAPRRPDLRLVGVSSPAARGALRWGRAFASLFVFGQMLMLPLVERFVDPDAGRALSVIVLLITLALAATLVMRLRRPVALALGRRWRIHRAGKGQHMAARYWTVPVLIYLAVLAIVVVSRPVEGFYAVLIANGQIAIAILVGMIVFNLITRMIGNGIQLPERISDRVPLLETRLNAFVPKMLYAVRLFVVVLVVAFCFNTLGVFDFVGFLESQVGARLAGTIVTVTIILVVAFGLWLVLNSWVDYRVNPDYSVGVSSREKTLLVLLRNALTIALILIVLMFVLAELGLNIAPLLASAGVIGLAIGFGAQKMVQDIITGVFIQLEGAIDVGDVVQIGGISGVVERLTVRSAALRDLEGAYHVIPFSSVDVVTNFMRGFSYALLDIGVAYREDTEEARQAMYAAFEELCSDPELKRRVIGDLEWMGLNAFGASEVILRARIKTLPGEQWGIKRAYNAILKRIFDNRGIEIPFPHQTVYFGVDKAGNAPPLHMVREDTDSDAPESGGSEARKKKPKKDEVGLPDVDEGPVEPS